jgi:hypothetical protein
MNATDIGVKYNSWHERMNAAGRAVDPLVFPWYMSAFDHIKEHVAGAVNLPFVASSDNASVVGHGGGFFGTRDCNLRGVMRLKR